MLLNVTLAIVQSAAIVVPGASKSPHVVLPAGASSRYWAASCDCNDGSYYVWRPATRRWQPLDWERWWKELARRLPPGLSNVNGFWPELRTMTAEGSLWRAADAHCCSTGGSVRVELGIANNRFVLRSVRVSRDLPR